MGEKKHDSSHLLKPNQKKDLKWKIEELVYLKVLE